MFIGFIVVSILTFNPLKRYVPNMSVPAEAPYSKVEDYMNANGEKLVAIS
jgi:hypothetical protein